MAVDRRAVTTAARDGDDLGGLLLVALAAGARLGTRGGARFALFFARQVVRDAHEDGDVRVLVAAATLQAEGDRQSSVSGKGIRIAL